MSALDPIKTYKNLKKKGFVDSTTKSDDHKYLEFTYNGKHVLHTKLSHNKKDIDDYLIRQMSTQCKLSKSEFLDLVNCPLSKEGFIEILENKGLLK
jgi:hypothetical protein